MTTVYVEKAINGGNDSNSGLSQGSPKLTLAAGVGAISGSGAVEMGDGVWAEALRSTVPAGSSGNPTIIRSRNLHGAILRPTGGVNVVTLNHNYIKLDGVDFDAANCTGSPIDGYNAGSGVSHITITRCIARNGHGITSSSSGIAGDFDFGTIEYCEVYGNDTSSNQDHGIYHGGDNCTIRYNYVHGNGAYGIHLYPSANDNAIYANRITSNILRGVIISGNGNAFYLNLLDSNAWGLEVRGNNNLVFANALYNNGSGSHAIWLSTAGSTGNICQDNLYYLNSDNTIVDAGASNTVSNNRSTNPSWTDPANHDFTLQSGSPCRGAGIDLSGYGITTDFAGHIRPAISPDQGPYQFASVIVAAVRRQLMLTGVS